jgi:N-acetyltransferase
MSDARSQNLAMALRGSRVALEPLGTPHRERLWEAAQAPEIWTWTSQIAASREDFDAWFDAALAANDAGERGVFAVLEPEQGACLGSSSFHTFYPADRVVEIGATWLSPSSWGSGANVEAKLLMFEHAFEYLGCLRVELRTDPRNGRSRAAIAATGAQFEGVLRKQKTIKGVGVRDSAVYSVIDDDWPAVRANLERRLAANQ